MGKMRALIPLISLFLLVGTLALDADQLNDAKHEVKKMSRDELETKYHDLLQKVDKLQKTEEHFHRKEKIQMMSNSLIRQAGHELDDTLRSKELKTAADLFEHPF